MAILYGPFAGVAIGFIGHALKDLVFSGLPWFSWVIASAIVGLIIGLAWKRLKVNDGEINKKEMIIFNIYQAKPKINPTIADAITQLNQGKTEKTKSFNACPINPIATPANGPYNIAIKAKNA